MFKNGYYTIIRFLFSVLFVLIEATIVNLHAQDNTNVPEPTVSTPDYSTMDDVDLLDIKLPLLDVFLQTAESSPVVMQAKAYEKEQSYRLNVTKKEWMNYIRGVANYSYGSMGSMTESSATGQGTYFQYFGEVMSLFNVGGSITVPLDLFFGRTDKIKAGKAQVEQAKYQTLQTIEDRKIVITELYAAIIRHLRLLKTTAEATTVAESNVRMGELDYINGSITLQEISGRKRDLTLAMSSYEESKAELFKAVMRLEMITGIKIIK